MNYQIRENLKMEFQKSFDIVTQVIQVLTRRITIFYRCPKHGKPRIGMQKVVAAILFKLKSGRPWRKLPPCFGKWRTVYGWFRKLAVADVLKIKFENFVIAICEKNKKLLKHLLFDGSLIPAKNGGKLAARTPRAQNKSCVNAEFLTTKNSMPINFIVASGTNHDSILLESLLAASAFIIRLFKCALAHGDKGFDAKNIRLLLASYSMCSSIPHRQFGNVILADRPPDRIRAGVERFFARLKQFRNISISFDRLPESIYLNLLLASFVIAAEKTPARKLKSCLNTI